MKTLSNHNFQLEKNKRKKRGVNLIDASLKNQKTWYNWDVFKRYAIVAVIWTCVLGYFIYKYLAK